MDMILIGLTVIIVALLIVVIVLLVNSKKSNGNNIDNDSLKNFYNSISDDFAKIRNDTHSQNSLLRSEISTATQNSINNFANILSQNQDTFAKAQNQKMTQFEARFQTFSLENEQKLELIRNSIEKRLAFIQEDNSKKLEQMRHTVDEKLQQTINERMNQSFSLVNERLEQVYKGLGEMQTLAVGVGDLKKVLSNVKTRGILGEFQLSAILKEILSTEQYEENVVTKKGSTTRVEFAVKFPQDNKSFVYLPIDSKFPADSYTKLQTARENCDSVAIDEALKQLKNTLKSEARDIRDKYIDPPNTTDFAIMFIPFEGLYAEVVNMGMVEVLQREFKVNIAGPSTMAALLNSLQMGFKTLAVQKRSVEVWKILSDVKKEFDTFSDVLEKTQRKLDETNTELDKLVGVRTRQIQKKLMAVQNNSDIEELQ